MNAGGIGTGVVLFLVWGRVKDRPRPLRSGQMLACLTQVAAHGFGHVPGNGMSGMSSWLQ